MRSGAPDRRQPNLDSWNMNALLLTNEFPPHIYGGAGIHVQYLSRELAKLMRVHTRCFGDQNVTSGNLSALGFGLDSDAYTCPKPLRSVFGALQRSLDFNTVAFKADLVHCHTWYSPFGRHRGEVELRHSAGDHRAFARAAASVEARAAGRRIRFYRAGLRKTAIEMADAVIAVSRETKADVERLFDVRPEQVARHLQRDRPRGISTRPSRRPPSSGSESILPSHMCSLWAASRGRRGSSTSSTRSNISIRVSRSFYARALPIRRRSARK